MTTTAVSPPAPTQPPIAPKLCRSCGAANPPDAAYCQRCSRGRFAPPWVRALRKVGAGFTVQVNDPHEKSKATEPTLTFYKWWFGGRAAFHIHSQEQWERIKQVVDTELLAILGWTSRQQVLDTLADDGVDARAILAQNPSVLLEIVTALGEAALAEREPAALAEAANRIAVLGEQVDRARRAAFRSSVEELPPDRSTGPRQLAELSGQLAEAERLAALAELRRRVGVLELFGELLHDERSYRIVNHRSAIHRLLEESIWILDERCWLRSQRKVLRAVIDRRVAERDRPYAKKPPDFAFAVDDGRLLVVSICPPSREPGVADLDRLERQVGQLLDIEPYGRWEATLVGERIPWKLRSTLGLRNESFAAKSYEEVFDEPLQHYRARLGVLNRLGAAAPATAEGPNALPGDIEDLALGEGHLDDELPGDP
ncbi:MAG: hypothetical protein WB507_11290 [Solirubrobacterales bacterium]